VNEGASVRASVRACVRASEDTIRYRVSRSAAATLPLAALRLSASRSSRRRVPILSEHVDLRRAGFSRDNADVSVDD